METRNALNVLEEEEMSTFATGLDKKKKERANTGSLLQGRVIVLGDSQVKHLDSAFCARDRKCKTRVCQPGAGIDRVAAGLDTCLGDDGTKPIVVLSAGGMTFVRSELRSFLGSFNRL